MGLAFFISLVASPVYAVPSAPQRIVVENVSLDAAPGADLQLQIWSDELSAIAADRKTMMKITPELKLKYEAQFFTTTFKSGDTSIVVSAVNRNCYPAPSLENTLVCPARVAQIKDGKLSIVATVKDFAITIRPSGVGFDEASNRDPNFATYVSYDPATRKLSGFDVNNGQRDQASVFVQF
jgi:hypothetical protein